MILRDQAKSRGISEGQIKEETTRSATSVYTCPNNTVEMENGDGIYDKAESLSDYSLIRYERQQRQRSQKSDAQD